MHLSISRVRQIAVVCIIVVLFGIIAGNLFRIQIFNHEKYAAIVSAVSEKDSSVPAARGEIVDRYGKKLVYNEQVFDVIFDVGFFPSKSKQAERNEIIASLTRLFDSNRLEWTDNLPLVFDIQGNIQYKKDSDALIEKMKSREMLNLNEYATAQNCFDALVERYELEEYSPKQARKIASVLFDIDRVGFSFSGTYTFAKNVPDYIISTIKENSSFYRGVDTQLVPVRTFADGTLAPHILGLTGKIDADEYAKKKEQGYSMDATIGKSGIELAMEEYLRGTDGEKTVYTDADGKKSTEITKKPIQGNTIVLTIDSGMQKVAQDALKLALESYSGKFTGIIPNAGAIVVLSCKDSSVLASASYPTYDISTYSDNVKALNKTPGAPLWNRALMSTYACGSTAKPAVAIAALEEGIIDEDDTIYCNGAYTYMGQSFKCEQAHVTAFVNIIKAIDESCNTFFMELGNMLGIEKMNEYRVALGLGAKTGIELNEAVGVLDSPEYRTSINQHWLPGYVIQSAIGQAGNLWTPIQLANYVNTIANGGTRYRAHFVKSIKSFDYGTTLLENTPEILCQTGFSAATLDIVKRGMREVGVTGYCASAFAHLPVEVACKTGTSQEYRMINGKSTKINNGFLIAFAPYDNPEIAVAVLGEGMSSGKFVAPVVASIVEYYCGMSDTTSSVVKEGVLIP